MRASLLVILFFSLLTLQQTDAQEVDGPSPRFLLRAFGELAVPQAEFERNMDKIGLGIGFDALYRIRPRSPVSAGIAMHTLAFDTRALNYEEGLDGVIYSYRERTTSRLFALYGAIRYQPEVDFFLHPFFQVQAGWHHFFTNTKIKDRDIDETVDRIHEGHNSVPGYGLQAGLLYFPERSFWSIDFRAGYTGNSSVSYFIYNEDLDDGQSLPIFSFEEKDSPISLLSIQLGVTFEF